MTAVPFEWQDRGEELERVWRVFGPPELVERAVRARELAELAATWEDCKFQPGWQTWSPNAMEWEEYKRYAGLAMDAVVARLSAGELLSFGSPGHPDADPMWIAGTLWPGLRPDQRTPNAVRGPGVVFYRVRILAAAEWFEDNPSQGDAVGTGEEGAVVEPAPKQTLLKSNAKFASWFADKGSKPTTRDVGDFARDNDYTRKSVENLVVSRIGPRSRGRRPKGNAPK